MSFTDICPFNLLNVIIHLSLVHSKSFDDKSFTPNGFTGQRFYETVGIGKETLQGTSPGYVLNIALPQHKMFQHAGFSWIFVDMNNPDRNFTNYLEYPNSRGIFLGKVISHLNKKNIKLNITAVYTAKQTARVLKRINKRTKAISLLIGNPASSKEKQ